MCLFHVCVQFLKSLKEPMACLNSVLEPTRSIPFVSSWMQGLSQMREKGKKKTRRSEELTDVKSD